MSETSEDCCGGYYVATNVVANILWPRLCSSTMSIILSGNTILPILLKWYFILTKSEMLNFSEI